MPLKLRHLALPALAAGALIATYAAAQVPQTHSRALEPTATRAEIAQRFGEQRHERRGGGALRLAAAVRNDPAIAVVINLRAIERAYRADGRSKDLPAFYREQLARTQDPVVRNFVHYRLARIELRGDDAKGALEALQRNLDENYRRL